MKLYIVSFLALSLASCGKLSFTSSKSKATEQVESANSSNNTSANAKAAISGHDTNQENTSSSESNKDADPAQNSPSGDAGSSAESNAALVASAANSSIVASAASSGADKGDTASAGISNNSQQVLSGETQKKVIGKVSRNDFTQFAGNYCETQNITELSPTSGKYTIFCFTGISPYNNVVGNFPIVWNSDWFPEFSKLTDIKVTTVNNTGNLIFSINGQDGPLAVCPYNVCAVNNSFKVRLADQPYSLVFNVQNRCNDASGACQSQGNFFMDITYNY